MADDTETKNDVADENGEYEYEEGPNPDDNPTQAVDSNNAVESTTVVPSPQPPSDDVDNNADAAPAADSVAPVEDNYEGDYDDDEPLPDVTVKLYINELPEGAVTDAINTFTDEYGNPVGGWSKAIEDYTSTIAQDLLDGNGTATGKQGWLGSWTWSKSLLVGLIALCIIGIIIALVCLVIGKRSKRNNSAQRSGSGTTSTAKAVVTKGVNPDTKYAAVPTDV